MSIFRTKSIEDVLKNSQIDVHGDPVPGRGHLAKNLRARDLIGFGIGIVIGTGIFTLTGLEAKTNAARPSCSRSWSPVSSACWPPCATPSWLRRCPPRAAPIRTRTTIGEIFAWVIAWDLILEFALGAAVVARGWSAYLQGVFPFLPTSIFGEDSVVNLGAVFIVLVLGAVAIKGSRSRPGSPTRW